MILGADYSAGRIAAQSLVSAGIDVAFRYVGIGSGPKRMTQDEYNDLRSHGLTIAGVVESTTDRSNAGYEAGVSDANAALTEFSQLDIYCCTNDQTVYGQSNIDYARGFCDTVGPRAWVYGFSHFLVACHNSGIGNGYWQCGNPPSLTQTDSFVSAWQRNGTQGYVTNGPANPATVIIDGIEVDLSNVYQLETETMSYVCGVFDKPVLCLPVEAGGSSLIVLRQWFKISAVDAPVNGVIVQFNGPHGETLFKSDPLTVDDGGWRNWEVPSGACVVIARYDERNTDKSAVIGWAIASKER